MGAVLVTVLRPFWGSIFSSDEDVQALIYKSLPIMFFYLSVDSTKCIALNVLRSCGRPQVTVVGNSFVCVFVMLPLGYLLSNTYDYGLTGLWFSMSIAWLLATVYYMYVVLNTDWNEEAKLAADRIAVSESIDSALEKHLDETLVDSGLQMI
jgi:MATE family multidrug resistance protein